MYAKLCQIIRPEIVVIPAHNVAVVQQWKKTLGGAKDDLCAEPRQQTADIVHQPKQTMFVTT